MGKIGKPHKPTLNLGRKPGDFVKSHASELTQSVGYKGGHINIPSIDPVRRMSVTPAEGVRMKLKATGGKPRIHATVAKAKEAAIAKSSGGGRYNPNQSMRKK